MFLSVILPTYNVSSFLPDCLASILRQDFPQDDYEAIFVDDGSSDDSGAILTETARKYPQIRYYRQENAGVSAARNRGIELASGDYVWFVDPDDIIALNAFQILRQAAAEHANDTVQRICFNYYSLVRRTNA